MFWWLMLLKRAEVGGDVRDVLSGMLFREGRHLVGNAFADYRGDACVSDAQAEEIGAGAVLSTAPRVVPWRWLQLWTSCI
jgi:hypothetical protein